MKFTEYISKPIKAEFYGNEEKLQTHTSTAVDGFSKFLILIYQNCY